MQITDVKAFIKNSSHEYVHFHTIKINKLAYEVINISNIVSLHRENQDL